MGQAGAVSIASPCVVARRLVRLPGVFPDITKLGHAILRNDGGPSADFGPMCGAVVQSVVLCRFVG